MTAEPIVRHALGGATWTACLLAIVLGATCNPVQAADGTWALAGEAPLLTHWNRLHGAALAPISRSPPSGAIVRSVSWSWNYPAMPGAITARICLGNRCIETVERSVFGDTRLAGVILPAVPAFQMQPEGPAAEAFGPVIGEPVTLTVEWSTE
ncbi:flagellar protein FlhE [Chthonobacter albigriseus]|uniref:flagellar protein FlhE n=1 Tax=Chthonobacter albigriseus TaxID=1683161 RepID=UPI0015EFBA57|nr:flagellar protein FlhE [Chthonobacter albigriseus]